MSKTILSSFNKADSILSVTLHSSQFSKAGEHYGRVSRNVVTLENIIADILEENRGLDPYMIQHSATLLQQQFLKQLSLGKGVNVLDLGTMYIGMKGTIKGDKPSASDLPDFMVKFTPSAMTRSAVDNLVVDKIVFADTTPQLSIVTDLWTGLENDSLTLGKACKISGTRLKLGGDAWSISFIQCDEDGFVDEAVAPIVVAPEKIYHNTATDLQFFIPEDLFTDKQYLIKISTMYQSSNNSRKTPVEAFSVPLTVNV